MTKEEDSTNLFKIILDQAADIDFSDQDKSKDEQADPTDLIIPGLEVSKLFAVVYWGLMHSEDEDSFTAGLNMMTLQQALKTVNGTFRFNVKPSPDSGIEDKYVQYYVDMRRKGEIIRGPGPQKPKPDCVFTLTDRDMIRIALGQMNPQAAFLKGKVKVKGNIMLGLRMQTVLMSEVTKMSRVAKL